MTRSKILAQQVLAEALRAFLRAWCKDDYVLESMIGNLLAELQYRAREGEANDTSRMES